MDWKIVLASITASVDQNLLLRTEYLVVSLNFRDGFASF